MKLSTQVFFFLISFSIFLIPNQSSAQEFVEKLTSIFEFEVGKNKHMTDSSLYASKVVIAPILTYEPATNLGFGIGIKFLFKPFGAGLDTRTSNIPISAQYTLNNQVLLASGYTVFFPKESFLLKGSLSYSKFPLGYFGVGSQSRNSDRVEISFNNLLIEPLLLKKILPNFFVGGGWRYNIFSQTRLYEAHAGLPEGYSLQDSLGSTSSGFEFAVTLDSRSNVLNARKGQFAEFTHGIYSESTGSTANFMLTKLDYRQYFQPFSHRDYDVLALQVFTRLSWGDTPPLELSSLGGQELLRGYQEGRFRDRFSFFTQLEYRWQALDRIGFVFFGGVGEVTNSFSEVSFDRLKYSLGTGFRLKIIKSENLNIRIDYGVGLGTSKDHNFYIGIAEAF